jgi:probable addiction module antidote protein
MVKRLTSYDPADDLTTDEAVATFMSEAFQNMDAAYIAHALGVVVRAKGTAKIASQTGLSRAQLDRLFSENGNPTLKTTLAVMKALGIELTVKQPTVACLANLEDIHLAEQRIVALRSGKTKAVPLAVVLKRNGLRG